MRLQKRVAKQWPEAIIAPARIGHHPIEIVEHAPDQQVRVPLRRGQAVIDFEAIFPDEMGDDGVAVADMGAVIHNVRELAARRILCVEDVLMPERQIAQLEEGKYFQAVRIVVGDPEQLRIRIQRNHLIDLPSDEISFCEVKKCNSTDSVLTFAGDPLRSASLRPARRNGHG